MSNTETTVAGKTIQIDLSGQGHNWKNIDADEIPSAIREELEGEILDGGREEGKMIGSNGLHYRWMSKITIDVDGTKIRCKPEDADTIEAAMRAADEGGTIQAWDMVGLSSDPRKHTATSVTKFIESLGGEML